MTFKVAVALEDHTNDQYVVVPVVRAVLTKLGKPHAKVMPITNPRVRGVAQLRRDLCSLLTRYGAIADLVVLVVDLDCEDGRDGRPDRMQSFVHRVSECDRHREKVVLVTAVNEVEVWALWGIRNALTVRWDEVRADCHPKERFFQQFLQGRAALGPDGGRSRLIAASLSAGISSLQQGCPELEQLEASILAAL